MAELVDPGFSDQTFQIRRYSKDHQIVSEDKSFSAYFLTPDSPNRKVEIYTFEFLKKGVFMIPAFPEGTTEYILVQQGELWVVMPDNEACLKQGDSLELIANQSHSLLQKSKEHGKGDACPAR